MDTYICMYTCMYLHTHYGRPEDTHKSQNGATEGDLNLLYWGAGVCKVKADSVCGKCRVLCGENIEGDKDDWFMEESDRFYFYEAYDSDTKSFVDPPLHTRTARTKGKVCGYLL